MASTSYESGRRPPLYHSLSFNIPRSKTPGPSSAYTKPYATEHSIPRRTRTPLPHEEDIRHCGRSMKSPESNADRDFGQYVHAHKHMYARNPSPSSHERKRQGTSIPTDTDVGERGHAWDGAAGLDVDHQVHIWMMQEERRRLVAAREAERTRLVQDEVRHILLKHEIERLKILEQVRLEREEQERDRIRRQRHTADRVMANAWAIYERNWAAISASSEPLSFASIPWPTLSRPSTPSSITLAGISTFLLSEAHSPSQKPKERIKEALRRWHPDRFVRFVQRVPSEERATVEEAVRVVAQCLNELLGRHSE